MSEFYGNVCGNRGEATRGGSANSGIRASACSWHGSVTVSLDAGGGGRKPILSVYAATGSQVGGRLIFRGSIAEFEVAVTRGAKAASDASPGASNIVG